MATYFVNFTNGLDANPGTELSPWKNIDPKVNGFAFAAGDICNLDRGEKWRQTFSCDRAGSAGSLITLGAYGSGVLPEILGSDTVSGSWTNTSGNLWEADFAGSTAPTVGYWEAGNGTLVRMMISAVEPTSHRQWRFLATPNRVQTYWTSGPPNETFESPQRARVIDHQGSASSRSYWTFQNLRIAFGGSDGCVRINSAGGAMAGITIDSCEIIGAGLNDFGVGGETIAVIATAGDSNNSDLTIKRCLIKWASNHGIQVYANAGQTFSGFVIEQNEVVDNGYNNIDCNANTAGTVFDGFDIRYNKCWATSGMASGSDPHGIFIQRYNDLPTVTNVRIYYNLLYDNLGSGVALSFGVEASIIGNTFYGNGRNGTFYRNCLCQSGTAANTVKNNISMDPALNTACLYLDSLTNKTIDYNDWYQTTGGRQLVNINGTGYTTLADWKAAANPQAQNDLSADPLFVNAGAKTFTLQSGSPCKETGADLGASYDDGLDPDSTWPSAVGTLDQDLYGTGWEIGAYVYQNPPANLRKKTGGCGMAGPNILPFRIIPTPIGV